MGMGMEAPGLQEGDFDIGRIAEIGWDVGAGAACPSSDASPLFSSAYPPDEGEDQDGEGEGEGEGELGYPEDGQGQGMDFGGEGMDLDLDLGMDFRQGEGDEMGFDAMIAGRGF